MSTMIPSRKILQIRSVFDSSALLMDGVFLDFGFFDLLDIVLAATFFYHVYKLLRHTVAVHILIGLMSIYLAWKLVEVLKMELLSEILGQFIGVGVLAVIVVFQQEIRSFLMFIGRQNWRGAFLSRWLGIGGSNEEGKVIETYVLVSFLQAMMASKTGVLLVFRKSDPLESVLATGVRINADFGDVLLRTIFFKNSPLHDGAVVIGGGLILSAGGILPVSDKKIPSHYGLRHRAALGLSERTDAVCVIVSEESGHCTIAYQDTLQPMGDMTFLEMEECLKDRLYR